MSKRNSDSEILPFHVVAQVALTAGAFSTPLSPTTISSTRAASVADNWAHFRVRKFKFRVHVTPSSLAQQAVGYVGGVQDTLPSTFATICELIPACIMPTDQTVPSDWQTVPRCDLAGPLPWYKSIPGTADPTEEAPGYLVANGATTETVTIEMRGVFEFKTSVAPANTPAELALRARLRAERIASSKEAAQKRVLALLGCQPVSAPTTALNSGRVVIKE